MKKTAFITGATSGIGREIAREFAKHTIRLILCGRRQERLDELQTELSSHTEVHTLNFDVRDKEKVAAAVASLPENFQTIDILINNAGNAHGLDSIQNGNVDDWDAMLDINVKGLLYVSNAIIPQMVARNSGHILNIGSTAGKEVYPNGNVYCASKHAVDALNQGMRLDLNAHGIRVGAINPGLVETEFSDVRFKGDTERAEKVYQGFQPLTPKDVAETAYFYCNKTCACKYCRFNHDVYGASFEYDCKESLMQNELYQSWKNLSSKYTDDELLLNKTLGRNQSKVYFQKNDIITTYNTFITCLN